MRRWPVVGAALLVATAGIGGNAWAASSPAESAPAHATVKKLTHVTVGHKTFVTGTQQILRVGPRSAGATVPQGRALRPQAAQPAAVTAKFNVTYVGFSTQARAAFQAAVDIWSTKINSAVPINVTAKWSDLTSLGDGVLGAAGPTEFVKDFKPGFAVGTYFPIALANAISGTDLMSPSLCNPGGSDTAPEISASFNSAFGPTQQEPAQSWYLGTDGQPGPNQIDFETVVLHELGHGLGFVGSYTGIDPNTGVDTGKGYVGLDGNGLGLTEFDKLVGGSSGAPLTDWPDNSYDLGAILRNGGAALVWLGDSAKAANGGTWPVLYAPSTWEDGSSFAHLDEATYPRGNPNALMSPFVDFGEVVRDPGPIVLGMFADMGWPQTPQTVAPLPAGQYHVSSPLRLVSQVQPQPYLPIGLKVQVAGAGDVPESVRAVVVNITVQWPTRAGVVTALPGCTSYDFPNLPAVQNYQGGQTRTSQAVLPVAPDGSIEVSLFASGYALTGSISVDLVGWYGDAGAFYHQLPAQKQAFAGTVTSAPVDVKVLGVGGVPSSGVTAVVVEAGEGFAVVPGFLLVGPGGTNSIVPTVAYSYAELTQNLAIVPLGTGAGAGKIRVRLNTGRALAVLNIVGWYGPAGGGGRNFHSAGPARLNGAPHGQDVTVGGLPANTPVMLNVHVANPSATSTLSAASGGSATLAAVQEMRAGQNTSGQTVVTTNAKGQVRLHLSAGVATFYIDYVGWFSS